jgi:catechol 2,3-dioxygenase-like lactoylglutathione lyase family enzyme
MIGRLHHVVLDTPDPARLARFYADLLGLPITYTSDDWLVVAQDETTSGIAFQLAPDQRPPTWPDPATPQQFHLDVMVDDLAAAIPQAITLGARQVAETVFADPSGHLFCLVPRPHWAPPVGA